jgi:hypothetical protein
MGGSGAWASAASMVGGSTITATGVDSGGVGLGAGAITAMATVVSLVSLVALLTANRIEKERGDGDISPAKQQDSAVVQTSASSVAELGSPAIAMAGGGLTAVA